MLTTDSCRLNYILANLCIIYTIRELVINIRDIWTSLLYGSVCCVEVLLSCLGWCS